MPAQHPFAPLSDNTAASFNPRQQHTTHHIPLCRSAPALALAGAASISSHSLCAHAAGDWPCWLGRSPAPACHTVGTHASLAPNSLLKPTVSFHACPSAHLTLRPQHFPQSPPPTLEFTAQQRNLPTSAVLTPSLRGWSPTQRYTALSRQTFTGLPILPLPLASPFAGQGSSLPPCKPNAFLSSLPLHPASLLHLFLSTPMAAAQISCQSQAMPPCAHCHASSHCVSSLFCGLSHANHPHHPVMCHWKINHCFNLTPAA